VPGREEVTAGGLRACCFNILDIEFGGFFDIFEGFLASISLRNATGQAGDDRNVASVTFALQDHCVAQISVFMGFRQLAAFFQSGQVGSRAR
jgi:hypothetical protein